jgi:hypothetical protein
MDFFTNCKKHSDLCGIGLVIGVIITLILLWIYTMYISPSGAERFIDPSLDAQTQALLAFHNAENPPSAAAMKKMYKEKLENKKENPALTALLYR